MKMALNHARFAPHFEPLYHMWEPVGVTGLAKILEYVAPTGNI